MCGGCFTCWSALLLPQSSFTPVSVIFLDMLVLLLKPPLALLMHKDHLKDQRADIFLNYISRNEIRIWFCCFISQHTVSVSLGNFSSKWFFCNEIRWIYLSSIDFNIILSRKGQVFFFWCVLFCSKWAATHQLQQRNRCNLFTFAGKKTQPTKHLPPWKLSSSTKPLDLWSSNYSKFIQVSRDFTIHET